jgi:short-subunit dehydrogenase
MDHRSSRVVLVTGASAGIGRHVALDLARQRHRVFATGRNEAALAALVAEATSQKLALQALPLDVTSAKSIAAALASVRAQTDGHGVDVLINNAGYGQGGSLLEMQDEQLRRQFETNVFGLMAVTRAFAQDMVSRGRGWIVNVSSVGGRMTFPFFGAYHASKYAVEALSDALRVELRPVGIHVTLVEPGPIRSQFSETAFGSLPEKTEASLYAASYELAGGIRTATDRGSFGPQHVARAVRRAIGSRSPRARYVAPWFLAIPLALMPFVPTRLLDAVFRRAFGLHRTSPARRVQAVVTGLALLALTLGGTAAHADPEPRWENIRTEEGIVVSRKEVPGSPFVAFRGEGDVSAPLLRVGSVLVDVAREQEWMGNVADARILRRISDTEYHLYSHVSTPPTMSDRDFVTDVTISVDAARGTVVVRMRSIDDPAAPQTSYVRGELEESSFSLSSIDGGTRTHVVAEIHCDPKGSVAGWLVNFFQKNWGYDTLSSLRRQVAKPDISENAQLRAKLEDHAGGR